MVAMMWLTYDKSPIGIGTGYLGHGGGGILMSCPICGRQFRRAPSHAARVGLNCCSRGCAAKAREVRIETHCVVCGKAMEQTPSNAERVTVCSKLCSSIRRRKSDAPKKSSFAAYKKAAEEISMQAGCVTCGVTHGPWVVRGLRVSFDSESAVVIDRDNATLWCRNCHLRDIAPVGGEANAQRFLSAK